jgi:hypothetical protein
MGQGVSQRDPAGAGIDVEACIADEAEQQRISSGSSTECSSDEAAQSDPVTRPTSTLATPVLWQIFIMIPPPTG